MDDTKAFGTLTMHIIHTEPSPDPMDGPYLYVPEAKGVVKRTYPLRSFREQVFPDNSQDTLEVGRAFLRQNGCSAFQHTSKLNLFDVKFSKEARTAYYSEIVELVQHITGCAKVFLISSVTRGGDAEDARTSDKAEEAKKEEDNKRPGKDKANLTEHEEAGKKMASVDNLQPYHLPTTIKQGSNPYHEIHIWIHIMDPYPFHSIPRGLQHFHIHATKPLPYVPHVEIVEYFRWGSKIP
ncbi:hypothetical protein FOMA001_g17072 [Fusarium oxysporum f. sp. matthiolae]|nr:hypothetical protein FOMA001_g17072 [Fusarium oxysporum f. sp. matthiolae]